VDGEVWGGGGGGGGGCGEGSVNLNYITESMRGCSGQLAIFQIFGPPKWSGAEGICFCRSIDLTYWIYVAA
jgi:hypothetical protein